MSLCLSHLFLDSNFAADNGCVSMGLDLFTYLVICLFIPLFIILYLFIVQLKYVLESHMVEC